jgi:hypothetical protein
MDRKVYQNWERSILISMRNCMIPMPMVLIEMNMDMKLANNGNKKTE